MKINKAVKIDLLAFDNELIRFINLKVKIRIMVKIKVFILNTYCKYLTYEINKPVTKSCYTNFFIIFAKLNKIQLIMTIGTKIKTLRSLRGLSQEKMAELLEISTTSYAKIERDEVDITNSRIEQIASVLNISALELIGFGEKNFYYFHANNQNGNNGGFVVNNSVPMEFNEMKNKIEKLEMELNHLKEIIELLKNK